MAAALLAGCGSTGTPTTGAGAAGVSGAGAAGVSGAAASAASAASAAVPGVAATAGGAPPAGPGVCGLVPAATIRQILGADVVTQEVGPAVCLFHPTSQGSQSIEISRLPAATLDTQLADGGFTPLAGLGAKAYWKADEGLLVAVKGSSELLVNVAAGDAGRNTQSAAITVAKAALPAM